MPKGHLMDSQVGEVEDAVRASAIPFEDFKWDMVDGHWWTGFADLDLPTLVYKSDDFFFSFEYHPPFTTPEGFYHDPGGHQVYFKPGRETPTEHQRQLTWQKVVVAVRHWLEFVAREKGINAPTSVLPGPIQGILHQYRVTGSEQPPSVRSGAFEQTRAHSEPPREAVHHPKRERVLGAPINGWLEKEAALRGRFWTVVAQILGLIVAVAALILAL